MAASANPRSTALRVLPRRSASPSTSANSSSGIETITFAILDFSIPGYTPGADFRTCRPLPHSESMGDHELLLPRAAAVRARGVEAQAAPGAAEAAGAG